MERDLLIFAVGVIVGIALATFFRPRAAEPALDPLALLPPDADLETQVRVLLGQNRRIDAIKRVRAQLHLGLKEAKDWVEAIEAGQPVTGSKPKREGTPEDTDMMRQITVLLRAGNRIEAIKLYREQTGLGLAEAKAAVEAIERGL